MYTDSDEWHQCVKHVSWPIQPDILSPPLLRLTSRKPLWLDLQPVDIKSRWRHNWKLARVVNYHLVCNPTIQQPGFDLPRQQWCLLNHIRMEQGHCGACRRNCDLQTPICVLVAHTMSHIVESCPLTKLNGGLSRLHSADENAVSWLTSCGSWHAYENKKNNGHQSTAKCFHLPSCGLWLSNGRTNACKSVSLTVEYWAWICRLNCCSLRSTVLNEMSIIAAICFTVKSLSEYRYIQIKVQNI